MKLFQLRTLFLLSGIAFFINIANFIFFSYFQTYQLHNSLQGTTEHYHGGENQIVYLQLP